MADIVEPNRSAESSHEGAGKLNGAVRAIENTDTGAYIRKVLDLLLEPGDVVELRSPNTAQRTISGYFNDFAKLAHEAARLSGNVPAVYITVNPVEPALLHRAVNRRELCEGDDHRQTSCQAPIVSARFRPQATDWNLFH